MRKCLVFLSSVLLVAIGLLLLNDCLVKYLVFSSSNANMYRMYRLFDESHEEIPILGSSRAEAHFAPSELGKTVFNYGVSGSGQGETLIHLKALLRRGQKAPIIVNLDPWGMAGRRSIRGDYRLVDSDLLDEANKIKRLDWADRAVGLRFYGKLRPALADYVNARRGGTKTIDRGAILRKVSRTEEEWAYIIERCHPSRFALDEGVLSEYRKVLSADHPLVVFVVSPISRPWYDRWHGQSELAALLATLRTLPNTQVLDLCTRNIGAYGLDEFMDLTHLNEKGARRFSRELKVELEKLGIALE